MPHNPQTCPACTLYPDGYRLGRADAAEGFDPEQIGAIADEDTDDHPADWWLAYYHGKHDGRED